MQFSDGRKNVEFKIKFIQLQMCTNKESVLVGFAVENVMEPVTYYVWVHEESFNYGNV